MWGIDMRLRILVSILFLFVSACSVHDSEPDETPDGTVEQGDQQDSQDEPSPVDELEAAVERLTPWWQQQC